MFNSISGGQETWLQEVAGKDYSLYWMDIFTMVSSRIGQNYMNWSQVIPLLDIVCLIHVIFNINWQQSYMSFSIEINGKW